jgi:nicotinate-nucleotide--dimethylbenzimidazole phosphoribosyltransferase
MKLLAETCSRIVAPDVAIANEVQRLLDGKTKPRRSLGRLEDLACQIGAMRGTAAPALAAKAIVVMGADHGVGEEGVSAYAQEVTRQMLVNVSRGGAAVNVLARHVGARVVIVDMGAREPLPPIPGILVHRVGPGTNNFTRGPAMSREQAGQAVETGIRIAVDLGVQGVGLIGTGEMGIANTTASSALAAAFTGAPPEEVTGRGTGIDDGVLERKAEAVRRALAVNSPDPRDPVGVLAAVGGFEIAGLAGVILGAAAERIPIVLDGFISGAAALAAVRINPSAAGYLIASHRSAEKGHGRILQALRLTPLLDLGLRLGEGTGAALAMSLVEASLRLLHEMATFETAGVTDAGV